MNTFLCFPETISADLEKVLSELGYEFQKISDLQAINVLEPRDGWFGAIIDTCVNEQKAIDICRELRNRDTKIAPVILIVQGGLIARLDTLDDLFDEFIAQDAQFQEIKFRIRSSVKKFGRDIQSPIISYGPLALNTETYQAIVGGRHLDLTFMEYELLRFLASNPGKVFTRDTLLTRVWGYEYLGGARTVDVHIRRLRAKLGEEHAGLIETVRSVGYRFGRIHW